MGMERRVLLAIFLCFLVLYGYQALFVPPVDPQAPADQAAATSQQAGASEPGTADSAASGATPSSSVAGASTEKPAAAEAAPILADTDEREIRVENDSVIAVFTNRGGRLKSWRIKQHRDSNGEPVELVANDLATTHPLPFSLTLPDANASRSINEGLYVVSGAPTAAIVAPTDVAFEYQSGAGVRVRKTFHMDPTGYVLGFQAHVAEGGRELTPTIEWGPALGTEPATGAYAVKPRGLLLVDGEAERLEADDVTAQPVYEGTYGFAGVEDNYFMAAALDPGAVKVTYRPVTIPPAAGTENPERPLMAFSIQPAQAAVAQRFFLGPKDFDVLQALNPQYVRAIDFGIFTIIVVPLLRSLKWINGFVGNYGWSIIILTVIINALMFPLRHKSVVSMRRMQEIQPEAKAIQERYAKLKATDPAKQKMNQELMALYRERGANPAAGCLPILLTMPVLVAFYALLVTAIELRGAPFMGWIHDLSRQDPYYVIPIMMGLTQVWQQRITPQTGVDPAQQKLMMFMPVMMMAFFLWAPAGVVLYWFVSNAWGIGQQYLTNYLIGPPNIRAPRPPAERKVKRVGAGKTDAAARES